MGKLLDRISEPALAGAIRDHDIDPADALRQLQSQGCLEQHSQNFDIWQWIVPSAHAASCTLTTLSGKTITITDREGCIAALVDSFYAQTIGIVENRQAFEEGLMNGVKGQGKEFVDLFSDPTGMAKALTNVAWEIANDPVAAGLKYGFNAADALSESSALYLKALANNDYVTAGQYMGRFAMDMAIAIGTAEAGSAIEGALFGAKEAAALEKIQAINNPNWVSLPPKLSITDAQWGKKIGYHMADFGLDVADAAQRAEFRSFVEDFGVHHDQVLTGRFRVKESLEPEEMYCFMLRGMTC